MKGYVMFSKGLAFTNLMILLIWDKCNRNSKKTPAKQVLTFIETFRDFYDWDN